MSNQAAYAEIVTALQPYFDGLYDGDVAEMRRIFHPSCHLYSAPDGVAADMDMETYYARVSERPSPRSLNQARHDAIITIVASGEGGAVAVLRTARAPRLYTDFLSLLHIDGRWQIVAKTYSWTTLPAG